MVPLASLWLAIVLSAVIVFVASSIIHMVLQLHRNDIRKLPDEDAVLDAVRRANVPPGDYAAPHSGSAANMKNPEFVEKWKRGPILMMTVAAGRVPGMANSLILWFVYSLIVSWIAGYVASRALGTGASYLDVFRFVGTVAFASYSLALMQHSIWYLRNWGTTLKSMLDGLIYGLLTAGVFGWLWPR